eukprot:361262-Chlamydomonas_euryale.AAC.4
MKFPESRLRLGFAHLCERRETVCQHGEVTLLQQPATTCMRTITGASLWHRNETRSDSLTIAPNAYIYSLSSERLQFAEPLTLNPNPSIPRAAFAHRIAGIRYVCTLLWQTHSTRTSVRCSCRPAVHRCENAALAGLQYTYVSALLLQACRCTDARTLLRTAGVAKLNFPGRLGSGQPVAASVQGQACEGAGTVCASGLNKCCEIPAPSPVRTSQRRRQRGPLPGCTAPRGAQAACADVAHVGLSCQLSALGGGQRSSTPRPHVASPAAPFRPLRARQGRARERGGSYGAG